MRRLLLLVFGLLPTATFAQLSFGPSLTGTASTVNAGSGNQTDPHVSCDSVAYTSEDLGTSEIRFHNLRTQMDQAISSGGAFDSLSDVNGTRIVFTRTIPGQSAIFYFNTAVTNAPARELDPLSGSQRLGAAIGGNTVAWQDFSYGSTALDSELVVYDLVSGVAQRLTHDTLLDRNAAVSPDGKVVVWAKCQTTGAQCDVYKSVKTGNVWSAPAAVTGANGDDTLPDTNGAVLVYGSVRGMDQDVFFQPVAGGMEQQLVLPGEDGNPNVSGSLIAFEHLEPSHVNRDILLYGLSTQTAYRLTQTPTLDETLNDISVCPDGLVRVVYTVREGLGTSANFNVYAFSFRITPAPPECNNGTCADPGTRPLLESFELKLKKGKADTEHEQFKTTKGQGLLCIDNDKANGLVVLNCGDWDHDYDRRDRGASVVFKSSAKSIERKINLEKKNKINALIVGDRGSSYKVRVYGTDSACKASNATNSTSRALVAPEDFGVAPSNQGALRTVVGEFVAVGDDGLIDLSGLIPPPAERDTPPAESCSSSGGGPLTALTLLCMCALWRRRRTPTARSL